MERPAGKKSAIRFVDLRRNCAGKCLREKPIRSNLFGRNLFRGYSNLFRREPISKPKFSSSGNGKTISLRDLPLLDSGWPPDSRLPASSDESFLLVLVQSPLDLLEELLGQFLLDHKRRGDGVAQEDREEDEARHRYLPLFALVSLVQVVQRVRIVELENVAHAEERQQEAQTFPHPAGPTCERESD